MSILALSNIGHYAQRVSATAALLLVCVTAHAQSSQGQSMEERLRAQLRITTSQLQEAQNEIAVFKSGKKNSSGLAAPSAPSDVESLKKELARSQAAERLARESLGGSRQQNAEALEKASAQITQFRNAYDELLKLARASEAERQRLASASATQRDAVALCEQKNAQLYAVGQEILQAYETIDVGTVMSARQPFAAQSRVKFEKIAQQYGDKLYEGRFDVRNVNVPAAATVTSAPPQN